MSKRLSLGKETQIESTPKRRKSVSEDYFERTLKESGLNLMPPPEKCVATFEIIVIIRNLKKILQKHDDFPQNLSVFFEIFKKKSKDLTNFKHYLFPNIERTTTDNQIVQCYSDSVVKILLSIPFLQNKLTDYIFEVAIDLAANSQCGPWIQMILKCLCSLDNVTDSEKIAIHIINLLDVASEKMVRLEIITAIPDIIGDQAHDNIAAEMSRILQEDHELIPGILDCLSYLCLSDEQYEKLQKETLNILKTITKCGYFPNFVKFLLISGKTSNSAYVEAVEGIRNALSWPSSLETPQDIASSQILTAQAIRNTIISSKSISNAWIKLISNCNENTDHKPFDFVIILIIFSTSEEKQKQLENIIRKQIKLNVLSEDMLAEAFKSFKPILKDYLKHLISLSNSLLKTSDFLIQSYASHIYTLMFEHLDDSCPTIVAELLQLGLDCKHCLINILTILNDVASKNMSVLKQQGMQMLTLLDRKDDMTLNEIRAVLNLVCGLAYGDDNSMIKGDVHMIIRKYLGRSNYTIKLQGILAGVHAVKYLMASTNDEENEITLSDDISYNSGNYLPEGNLRDAAQIIELISCSTRKFPKMIAFFYDEFCKIIQTAQYINKNFLKWITAAVTNDLAQNFVVNSLPSESIGELKLSMQYCLNTDTEVDDFIAINIAGLTLQEQEDVNILILSPLFQLVQTLEIKQNDGNLKEINALLGCPVVMPVINDDQLEDELSHDSIALVLDCQIHCVNWFRELLNAFSTDTDPEFKSKLINKVIQIQKLEALITNILVKSNLSYQPPSWLCYPLNKNVNEQFVEKVLKKQTNKTIESKKRTNNDSMLPESSKSQATQKNISTKTKLGATHNIQLRPLNLKLLELLKMELSEENGSESLTDLTVKTVTFILKNVNKSLEKTLPSKSNKNPFLNKSDVSDIYDPSKAKGIAVYVNTVLPKIMEHLDFVTSFLDTFLFDEESVENEDSLYNDTMFEYVLCLEYIYNFLTIYLKWMGFRKQNKSLLISSLQILSKDNNTNVIQQDLLKIVADNLLSHKKYCIQISTAISLIELLKALREYSCNLSVANISIDMAKSFLSKLWKTPDGVEEKGPQLNQSIDILIKVLLSNNDIVKLKDITLLLINDAKDLKKGCKSLASYKNINKNNFSVLFRNIGSCLYESTKNQINKRQTNSKHLELWNNVTIILNSMLEITKSLDTRNNIIVFLNKSLPVIKLFLSHGIPILQIEFKNKTQEIIRMLKSLQQSTRYLQYVCCDSKLKKSTLICKVPKVKQLLETLIYKVQAVLASNKCNDLFWVGNLKNKNIHGEIICSQNNTDSDDAAEDCDEQFSDDDGDISDDLLTTDTRSNTEFSFHHSYRNNAVVLNYSTNIGNYYKSKELHSLQS